MQDAIVAFQPIFTALCVSCLHTVDFIRPPQCILITHMNEQEDKKNQRGGEREWERDWDREKSAPRDEETDTDDELSEKD